MRRNVLIPLCLVILGVLPGLVLADCADLAGFTSFAVTGYNTVTLYGGSTPAGRFDVQNCEVQPTSRIQLIKATVCDGDEVLIDGSKCRIMNVSSSVN